MKGKNKKKDFNRWSPYPWSATPCGMPCAFFDSSGPQLWEKRQMWKLRLERMAMATIFLLPFRFWWVDRIGSYRNIKKFRIYRQGKKKKNNNKKKPQQRKPEREDNLIDPTEVQPAMFSLFFFFFFFSRLFELWLTAHGLSSLQFCHC